MNVYEMAKRYYPCLWNKARLEALVEAKRLSKEEMVTIINQNGGDTKN